MALRRSCCWVSVSTMHKQAHKTTDIVHIHARQVKGHESPLLRCDLADTARQAIGGELSCRAKLFQPSCCCSFRV